MVDPAYTSLKKASKNIHYVIEFVDTHAVIWILYIIIHTIIDEQSNPSKHMFVNVKNFHVSKSKSIDIKILSKFQ